MTQSVTDLIEYYEQNGVGVWKISDMEDALESGDLEEAEEHYVDTVEQESMKGTVVVIGSDDGVGKDVLEHVNEKWSEIGDQVSVERTAYVAQGITKIAIVSKNEAESGEFKGFEDEDKAIEWASQA